jgi:hypothetical protein
VDSSERFPPVGGPIARPSLVGLVVLFGVERQIGIWWDVPMWSALATLVLTIALVVQVVVARSQEPPRPLRPLTLTSLGVAVLCTVLVLLSGAPSDRWFLLAWVVPATTALAEKIWPHLPNTTLVRIISGLLAVVIVGQLGFVWHAHTRHERASGFRDSLAQICTDTVSRRSSGTPAWIAANESMIAQLQTLTPPDQRTRELTGYLANALTQSEASFRLNDHAKQAEWQQLAREIAGDLDISSSCGVF